MLARRSGASGMVIEPIPTTLDHHKRLADDAINYTIHG